jgi:hypothetical protein
MEERERTAQAGPNRPPGQAKCGSNLRGIHPGEKAQHDHHAIVGIAAVHRLGDIERSPVRTRAWVSVQGGDGIRSTGRLE